MIKGEMKHKENAQKVATTTFKAFLNHLEPLHFFMGFSVGLISIMLFFYWLSKY